MLCMHIRQLFDSPMPPPRATSQLFKAHLLREFSKHEKAIETERGNGESRKQKTDREAEQGKERDGWQSRRGNER